MKSYLEASKKNPTDESITQKIAETYFLMNKHNLAYKNYKKIINYNNLDKDKAVLSLLYHKEISEEKLAYLYQEIESFNLSPQKLFYYKTSLSCVLDFDNCKKLLEDYLYWDSKNIELIEELQDIKDAIENYKNFKVQEIYYKNLLIVWAIFQNKLYPVSINLWKLILQEKPNYKPILQMIWKSYFELWKYELSKKYLSKHYELDQNNLDTIYLLWIVNLRQKKYILSSIFLKKALDMGHPKALNIKKRLAFNYFELNETSKMLSQLKDIVENEKDATETDYNLAIHHHIVHGKLSLAESFSLKAINIFTKNPNFYAYLSSIYIEKDKLALALKKITAWFEIDPKNPMLLYYRGVLETKKWNKKESIIYFKKVIKQDKSWEFAELAREEITLINE